MHKFFFAPAVCANIEYRIPALPDRWPGSNWETGKAWVEGTRPDPHSTPSPPLSYKSHKSTGDKSKTAQSTNSPDAGKGGKLTQKCQMSTKLRIMREKKEKNLKPEHLQCKMDRQCFWPHEYLSNEQCLLPPRPPDHIWWQIPAFKSQIDRHVDLVSEVAMWGGIFESWEPRDSEALDSDQRDPKTWSRLKTLLWRCSSKAYLVNIVAGDDKVMPISIMALVLTDRC